MRLTYSSVFFYFFSGVSFFLYLQCRHASSLIPFPSFYTADCINMGMQYFPDIASVPKHLDRKIRKSFFPPTAEEKSWMHLGNLVVDCIIQQHISKNQVNHYSKCSKTKVFNQSPSTFSLNLNFTVLLFFFYVLQSAVSVASPMTRILGVSS